MFTQVDICHTSINLPTTKKHNFFRATLGMAGMYVQGGVDLHCVKLLCFSKHLSDFHLWQVDVLGQLPYHMYT